jgi:hypothetical protein
LEKLAQSESNTAVALTYRAASQLGAKFPGEKKSQEQAGCDKAFPPGERLQHTALLQRLVCFLLHPPPFSTSHAAEAVSPYKT